MIAAREPAVVALDTLASEPEKPYGIITADCSSPHEYDDGIAITPMPETTELYKVQVFAVDTSKLYSDEEITRNVIEKTESRYYSPNTGAQTYEPMLPRDIIQSLHFARGTVRKALVISFLVGASQPPTDVSVNFGRVEVLKNYSYQRFGEKCRYREDFRPYGRAAALIMKHLGATLNDEEVYKELIHVPKSETWQRGSNINQAFMVAANHLVGRIMRREDSLAIYRTHNPENYALSEILDPALAHYSVSPQPHQGLGLDVYSRVTSPLRRSEDFVMHGLLKARADGREITGRDRKIVHSLVRRLNQRIAADSYNGVTMTRDNSWAKNRLSADRLAG